MHNVKNKGIDVFVSYSSSHETLVKELVNYLEGEYGITCWYSGRNLEKAKDKWQADIIKALRASKICLFVMSEPSLLSDDCGRELQNAADESKIIVPFRIDESDLKMRGAETAAYYLKNRTWISGFPNPNEKFEELGEILKKNLEGRLAAQQHNTHIIPASGKSHPVASCSQPVREIYSMCLCASAYLDDDVLSQSEIEKIFAISEEINVQHSCVEGFLKQVSGNKVRPAEIVSESADKISKSKRVVRLCLVVDMFRCMEADGRVTPKGLNALKTFMELCDLSDQDKAFLGDYVTYLRRNDEAMYLKVRNNLKRSNDDDTRVLLGYFSPRLAQGIKKKRKRTNSSEEPEEKSENDEEGGNEKSAGFFEMLLGLIVLGLLGWLGWWLLCKTWEHIDVIGHWAWVIIKWPLYFTGVCVGLYVAWEQLKAMFKGEKFAWFLLVAEIVFWWIFFK